MRELTLTPTQRRLLRERAGGLAPAPMLAALELDGPIDAERLDAAWQEVQGRHPFLRLRIAKDRASATDRVRPLVRGELPGASAGFRQAASKILIATARQRDLAVEGPAEAVLVRTGPEASLLFCSIDHVAVDGWSMSRVAKEWSALYRGERLPPPADPSAVLEIYNERARAPEHAAALDGVRAEFDGGRELPLAASSTGWELQQIDLPRSLVGEVRSLAARNRSTPFAVGLAAVGYALWGQFGSGDLIVTAHAANRSFPRSQDVVCAAYQTIPMRLAPEVPAEPESWLEAATKAVFCALARQHVPLDAVHGALGRGAPEGARSKLMVNFLEHPFLRFALPDVSVREAEIEQPRRLGPELAAPAVASSPTPWPAELTISFRETPEYLQLLVHYGNAMGTRRATALLGRVIESVVLLCDRSKG